MRDGVTTLLRASDAEEPTPLTALTVSVYFTPGVSGTRALRTVAPTSRLTVPG